MEKTASDNHLYPEGEEFIPLGRYAFVLVAWWREIILGAILTAVGGGGGLLAIQVILPQYESSADVAIIPTSTNVSIDDKLRTGMTESRLRGTEARARRYALVGLVFNGTVAKAVIERLGGKLDEEEAKAARLIQQISADMVSTGTTLSNEKILSDLIRITVRANTPEKASAIADAWGEEFVNHVNTLYQQVPTRVIRGITDEQSRAQASYETAQQNLEAFIANSKTSRLERRISMGIKTVEAYRALTDHLTESMFVEKIEDIKRARSVHEIETETSKRSLTEILNLRARLNILKTNARALWHQIEIGGEATAGSNELAILLLKTASFVNSPSELPANLEIKHDLGNIPPDTAAQMANIDAIVNAIERQIEIYDTYEKKYLGQITSGRTVSSYPPQENGSTTLPGKVGPEPYFLPSDRTPKSINGESRWEPYIRDVENQTRLFEMEREKELSKLADLTRERDLRRSALGSLQNERVELLLTKASAAAQVRLASQSVSPVNQIYPRLKSVVPLSGVAGLLGMMGFVFFVNAVGVRPLLGRRRPDRSEPSGVAR